MQNKFSKKQPSFRLAILSFCALLMIFSSCSKKSGTPATTMKGHTMKFVITVTMPASPSSASATVALVGAKAANGASTLWSVNGTTQQNQSELSFSNDAFPSGKTTTITIESVTSIYLAALDLSFVNSENNTGCKISYQAAIDGKTVNNDQNITVTSANSYNHDYSYGGN